MLGNGEGLLLSLDSPKSAPAPFLTKTYQLVNDSATDRVVSWGEDGATFVVWRPPEFSRDLLPKYFKHGNFSSFVRQLNTYGFRKTVPDRWEFVNENFKRGEMQLLCEIRRRKTTQPQIAGRSFFSYPAQSSISSPGSDDQTTTWCDSPPPPLSSLAAALSRENESLRRTNGMLVSELAHMSKLYNDIIYFVQNHMKPVTPANTYHHRHHPPPANAILGSPSPSSVTILEEPPEIKTTKLFGVSITSKKRPHPAEN